MEQITFLTLTAAVQNHYISSPQQSSMSLQHHSSPIPCHELLTCTRTLKGFLFGGVFSSFSWPRLYQEHTGTLGTFLGLSLCQGWMELSPKCSTHKIHGQWQQGWSFSPALGWFPRAAPFPPVQANREFRDGRQGQHIPGVCQDTAARENIIIPWIPLLKSHWTQSKAVIIH